MGFLREVVAFSAALSRAGVDFQRTLMIGRQALLANGERVQAALREAGISIPYSVADAIARQGGGYSEPLLRYLGARDVESVDASDYEGSTIVHDLNDPLPHEHREAYSVVLDGGTLEHVFNFPGALKTCLDAVEVGGHFVAVTPANNLPGHGFYQLTPELYYRVLSEQNGFRVRCMLWRAWRPYARWYRVADPAVVGHRVGRTGITPAQLYVAGQRVERREILADPPQQSDYAAAWLTEAPVRRAPPARTGLGGWLSRRLPMEAREARFYLKELRRARIAPADFQRVSLRDLRLD